MHRFILDPRPMRTRLLLGMCLIACSGAAAAETRVDVDCDVHSDYEFSLTDKSVILSRKTGAPHTVLMRQGRLFVDDAWVRVDAADRDRLIAYEREARATMPLARQIGHDAAEIAFTALSEVAKGFSDDPKAIESRLAEARKALDARLANSLSATHFNGNDLGADIGKAVEEVVPMVVGDIVSGALRAAFSGDDARLNRLDNLDEQIDALVQPRAKALERNAQALCVKMHTLDALDDALDYRHAGRPLDLLRVDTKKKDADG